MAKKKIKVKKTKKNLKLRIAALAVIAVILAVSLLFEAKINVLLGLTEVHKTEYDGETAVQTVTLGDAESQLNIHFIDVGQGDSCFIEFPDNKNMIIDGGDVDAKDRLLDYIDNNIDKDYIDYAVLTHSDADHCGSLDDVLAKYPAQNFYRPNVLSSYKDYSDPDQNLLTGDCNDKNTAVYKNVIEAAHSNSDVKVYINSWTLDGITSEQPKGSADYYSVEFYGPIDENYTNVNNYSPILVLEYGQGDEVYRTVLTGDAEKEAEKEFVDEIAGDNTKYDIFDSFYSANIIKLGHHGSKTSSSEDFLQAVTTDTSTANTYVIISCGYQNSYNHPSAETLATLKKLGFSDDKILRTDQNGSIVFSIKREGGSYTMYLGAEPTEQIVRETIDWRYIALSIFIASAAVLFGIPAKYKRS